MNNNSFGDLAVTGFSAPSEITVDETVDITLSLTNVGIEPVFGVILQQGAFSPGPRVVLSNFYISADDKLDNTDRRVDSTKGLSDELPIEPGETVTKTYSTTFNAFEIEDLTGDQFLIVDTGDGEFFDVEGVNTENNIAAIPITLKPIDFSEPSVIQGTAQADNLIGTFRPDEILGLAGNDTVNSQGDDDTIRGGDGRDSLFGENGDDQIFGGNGNDILIGWGDNDTLIGNTGNDMLIGNVGDDILIGGSNNDKLFGGDGKDTLFGNTGNDLNHIHLETWSF